MRIIATDFHTLLSPEQCERRVYLDARATETAEVSEFDEWLFEAGAAHEAEPLYCSLGGIPRPALFRLGTPSTSSARWTPLRLWLRRRCQATRYRTGASWFQGAGRHQHGGQKASAAQPPVTPL